MAALRELATQLGFGQPQTYLTSGNLVLQLKGNPSAAAVRLQAAITEHWGFHSDVIFRSAAAWPQYLVDNPFADACASQPQRVMLVLAQPPTAEQAAEQAAEHLRSRAALGEHVCAVGDALWIHFSALSQHRS